MYLSSKTKQSADPSNQQMCTEAALAEWDFFTEQFFCSVYIKTVVQSGKVGSWGIFNYVPLLILEWGITKRHVHCLNN
jgi:hypothetical protein